MAVYLADTWYVIALFDPFDNHHLRARRIDRFTSRDLIATHDGIFSEMLAYFSAEGGLVRKRIVEFVRARQQDPAWHVARASDLFNAALSLYSQRLDKEYSLVDCMSMTLMRERGITHVLTNDHHFRQEGFTVVNE
ncbi:MAG TPA: PIN domain-containing protein [Thermoanaerobaculia bacterium]|jgi:predicted nucleic acid-binding protein|nr:PIN domain-containing protein [Thermoanaerobaculia bacterium]